MATATRKAARPSTDRRIAPRPVLGRTGTLRIDGREPIEVTVSDLTRDGCRIETLAELERNASASIGLANVGLTACNIVWKSTRGYGCVFATPLSAGAVTAAFGPTNIAAFPGRAVPMAAARVGDKWGTRAQLSFVIAATTAAWAGIALAAVALAG